MTLPIPHVCLVNCQHPPDDVRVVEKLGRTLRNEGFDVSWVGPRAKSSPRNSYGVRYHFYEPGTGRIGRLVRNHQRAFALARYLPRADVYLGVEPDSAHVAVQLARLKGARSIFDVHEVYGDDMLQRWAAPTLRAPMRRAVRYGLQHIAKHVDLVMGVNDSVLEPYEYCKTPRAIVRNCAPIAFAEGQASPVFQRGDAGLVAMQGKATLAHGSIVVVKAFALVARHLSNLRVIFFDASDVTGVTREQFEALGADGVVNGFLDLRERIPMASMPAALRECDVGLITYNRAIGTASLPNKLFEFMAAGLPIIAPSYAREIRPIIERENCGLLVDCEEPSAVAGALEYLYTHREEAIAMGARAREAFISRHSFEAELAPVVATMRRWVDEPRPR